MANDLWWNIKDWTVKSYSQLSHQPAAATTDTSEVDHSHFLSPRLVSYLHTSLCSHQIVRFMRKKEMLALTRRAKM